MTTAQPAAGTALPATSLTAGLVFARNEADLSPPTLLAGSATISSNTPADSSAYATDADGRYKYVPTGEGQGWNGMAYGPEMTVLHIVKRTGTSGTLSAFDPNPPRSWILGGNAANVVANIFKSDNSTAGSGVANSGSAAIRTASPSSVVFLVRDTGSANYIARVMVDGVAGADSPYGGAPGVNTKMDILNRNGNANRNDKLYFTAVWNRALSDAELATLGANPWAIFDAVSADSTPPTFTGSLTVGTVTSNSIQVSWSAGSDNVGISAYETSLDGTTWVGRGTGLTYTFMGLSPSTSYTPRVRAKDPSGNISAVLSVTQSTSASADSTPPAMSGSISATSITQTTYTLSWSAATDAVGVTGYEVSLDGGATYSDNGNSTTRNVTGRTGGTTDSVRVRAYDAAGNRATPLSASVPLSSGVTATVTFTFKNNTNSLVASTTIPKFGIYKFSDMTLALTLTNQVTNGSGVLSVNNAAFTAGVDYIGLASDATGVNIGAQKVTAT